MYNSLISKFNISSATVRAKISVYAIVPKSVAYNLEYFLNK
jgi:hypothetical protein